MTNTERYLIFVGESYALGGIDDLFMITDNYEIDFLNNIARIDNQYVFSDGNHPKIYYAYGIPSAQFRFSWFELFDLKTKKEIIIELANIKR